MKRPLIGITSDYSDGYNEEYSHLMTYRLKSTYIDSVIRGGGIPFVIPFARDIDVEKIIKHIDGLVISGSGDDIHPYFTGRRSRPPSKNYIIRQEFEFRLAARAIEEGIPTLTICGGMQLINVLFGGTLIEDISQEIGSKIHGNNYFKRVHKIRIEKNSHLFRATGRTELIVNSTHHQAVYFIPSCLQISAISYDGIVEAVELKSNKFLMGVQFHPEALATRDKVHLSIFKYFIQKARRR